MRICLLILLTGLLAPMVRAQTQGSLRGRVLDAATGQALSFATIYLLRDTDSVFVKGTSANEKGDFAIDLLPLTRYQVRATQVGYQTATLRSVDVRAASTAPVTIRLDEESALLKEISVIGQKPFIEQQIDKLVVNVENSLMSVGNNALEVLEKLPGVLVDPDNRISLQGRSGVSIMVDGRLVGLGRNDLASVLRSYSAEEIQKIELITNPSARYDAAGNGGIINIILKKNVQHGLNGNVGGFYRQGVYGRQGLNANLNWRKRGFGVYAGYVFSNRNAFSEYSIERSFNSEGRTLRLDQLFTTASPYHSNSGRLVLDWYLNQRTTVGAIGTCLLTRGQVLGQNATNTLAADSLLRQTKTASTINETIDNYALSVYVKHVPRARQELVLQYDASSYRQEANQLFTTTLTTGDVGSRVGAELPARIGIQALRLDYNAPVGHEGMVETGLKSSWVTNDNALLFRRNDDAGGVNPQRSTSFTYIEAILAGYASIRLPYRRWTFQTGLRYERTEALGRQTTPRDSSFRRLYANLFPTVYLQRKLSETVVLKLTFTRRIDRPSYQDLNPFRYYVDPYTYKEGNPFLRPQFSNTVELSYVYRNALSSTINYSQTTDVITPVVRQDDASLTTYQTTDNLARQHSIGWTTLLPVPVRKWWMSINYVNVTRRQYRSIFLNQSLLMARTTATVNSTNNFTFGRGWTTELTGFYQSRSLYGIMNLKPIWSVSTGVQKTLWNSAGSLKLTVADLFWSRITRLTMDFANLNTTVRNRTDSRTAMLSFSYRWGSAKVASVLNRRSVSDDEKKRVKVGEER